MKTQWKQIQCERLTPQPPGGAVADPPPPLHCWVMSGVVTQVVIDLYERAGRGVTSQWLSARNQKYETDQKQFWSIWMNTEAKPDEEFWSKHQKEKKPTTLVGPQGPPWWGTAFFQPPSFVFDMTSWRWNGIPFKVNYSKVVFLCSTLRWHNSTDVSTLKVQSVGSAQQ